MNNHTRELLLMVGESGSGKSTYAKQYVIDHPNYVRVNRDDLRIELASEQHKYKGAQFEKYVAKVEKNRADAALQAGKSVIFDNTHLSERAKSSLENFAKERNISFRVYRMMTPMDVCIQRDSIRTGKARVGTAVIHRQFLVSGRLPIDRDNKTILVDIDGTLANMDGVRGPFEEHKVMLDAPYPKVIQTVNAYYEAGFTVIIVSGRHSTCGEETIAWLNLYGVKFHFILMRAAWDSRHDYIVKQEILDELLTMLPKENIELVIDDRAAVILNCWLKNGLSVQPVYNGELIPINEWTTEHTESCTFEPYKGFGRCPNCGAIESF